MLNLKLAVHLQDILIYEGALHHFGAYTSTVWRLFNVVFLGLFGAPKT